MDKNPSLTAEQKAEIMKMVEKAFNYTTYKKEMEMLQNMFPSSVLTNPEEKLNLLFLSM